MESAIAVRGAMVIHPPAFFVAFIRTVGGCVRLLSGRHGAVDREVQPAALRLPPDWSAVALRSPPTFEGLWAPAIRSNARTGWPPAAPRV